jgi:hypothetical protein
MLLNFNEILAAMPDDSRVWVYAASRSLTHEEVEWIQSRLNEFVAKWSTHGAKMTADACILANHFVVIAVDEAQLTASGCSIDSSVRLMKELGQNLLIDFFDRLKVYIEVAGDIQKISFHSLKDHGDGRYFDLSVNRLGKLRRNWPVPIIDQVVD